MAKRHYIGTYNHNVKVPSHANRTTTSIKNAPNLTNIATNYFWTAYSLISGNYVALVTVCVVVLLSFLLPDISQKIYATNELTAMKKILDMMSKEVSRAEVACLTMADEICCLHCSMCDGTTETCRNLRDLSVCTSRCMRTTQSEPVQVEKKIGFFRKIFFPNRNASHKEITIMSYVYTDSFDGQKNINTTDDTL